MKIEILPGAETDIIRQFRYYLVEEDAPLVAMRFRDSAPRQLASVAPARGLFSQPTGKPH